MLKGEFDMALIYHECGNPLWMEGKRIADACLAHFYDAREEGYGKKVIYCPTCNKPLSDN